MKIWNPFKKPIKKDIEYPVYLFNGIDSHYVIIYSENEGYHFSTKSYLHGMIKAYTTSKTILSQYTNSSLYKEINEDEFIDALDICKYLQQKEKLYILTKK